MKIKTRWQCTNCGEEELKWSGQCSQCQEWNTLVEKTMTASPINPLPPFQTHAAPPIALDSIIHDNTTRILTDVKSFDRMMGQGVVKGSLTLIGGDPGIGKSTLLLQLSHQMAKKSLKILYVCGEESVLQTSLRAKRLGVASSNIFLLCETNLEAIQQRVQELSPHILVIDSIQILYSSEVTSPPGSVAQVREVSARLMYFSKQKELTTFIIGHVTKSGEIAGPRVLEHLMDTVLYFEGDSDRQYRMIRSVKNRFGPSNELSVFSMTDQGLKEIVNPSGMFLKERDNSCSGSSVAPIIEGSRTFLVEIQALATKSPYPNPMRKTTGFDSNRFSLLLAVLEKRANIRLYNTDIFISVIGGLRLTEPAADLAAAVAILSSFSSKIIPSNMAFLGELGLNGEIRSVAHIEKRLKECLLMGFSQVVIPHRQLHSLPEKITKELQVIGIKTIRDAIKLLD
ncbi:DNA repair protein RadA [Chlamydiifrater phoenicopteri]|uniref:DNA repair protein RadA n=1 Tax=Chlamydiifrater phoenicopteri TaxID=2681469 RepID=UPI001BCD5A3F|nr:DNA repair protein RadA [Chlamydiifrater phoenicopteri]